MPGPRPEDLFLRLGTEGLGRLVRLDVGATVDGRYRHWDSLRHMTPPDGLDGESWWAGLQLARSRVAEPTGYDDADGRPFTLSLTPEAHRMLHRRPGGERSHRDP